MGPSGSGKSTLNLLGCLDTTSGLYSERKDVSQMRDDELAEIRNKEIGFVFKPSTFYKPA
jgi:putative ABC transport system ATP-binding protein